MALNTIVWKNGLRAGILGGGQLARMLAEAASRLGLTPVIFCEGPDEPAAQVSAHSHFGAFTDEAALSRFFESIDFAVLENEFVSCDVLERAASGVPILPTPVTLGRLRDKLGQKKLLQTLGIPTAQFVEYDGRALKDWIDHCFDRLGGGCVFKWGQLGYDGKGVMVGSMAQAQPIEKFCSQAVKAGVSLFAEAYVSYRRELALVAVCSTKNEWASYPLVVSEQKQGVCFKVFGPATRLGVSKKAEILAEKFARSIASETQMVGCFALELFELTDGEIWVNEIAPRVHNSGHYSLDFFATSQFENHWRAILGLALGGTQTQGGFVMLNCLGPSGVTQEGAVPEPMADVHVHWYGKKMRPGRKLGHLNGWVADCADLPGLMGRMQSVLARWEQALGKQEEK